MYQRDWLKHLIFCSSMLALDAERIGELGDWGPLWGMPRQPSAPLLTQRAISVVQDDTLLPATENRFFIAKITWAWHCEITSLCSPHYKRSPAELGRIHPRLSYTQQTATGAQSLVAGNVWESHLVKPLGNSVKVFFSFTSWQSSNMLPCYRKRAACCCLH